MTYEKETEQERREFHIKFAEKLKELGDNIGGTVLAYKDAPIYLPKLENIGGYINK